METLLQELSIVWDQSKSCQCKKGIAPLTAMEQLPCDSKDAARQSAHSEAYHVENIISHL
jgi:hypothetical protein